LVQIAGAQAAAVATIQQLAYQLKFSDYRDLDVSSIFSKAFVKGDKFEDWLGTMLWNDSENRFLSFRDINFDLTVTVTGALSGENILCNRERTPDLAIAKAVRASMSIQGVFRPVSLDMPGPNGEMNAVKCWDGGTTGNCRFDLPLATAPRRPVIASSLTYRGEAVDVDKGFLRSPWRLSRTRDHTISILMRENEQILLDSVDPGHQKVLVIRPPLSGLSTFDLTIPTDRKAAAIAAAREHALGEVRAFRNRVGL
jgi:predicted acylesterase/phospholipase RssA